MSNTDSWCFLPLCAVRREPIRDDTCSAARYMALEYVSGARYAFSLHSGVEVRMLNTDSWCFLSLCAVRRAPIRDNTCSAALYMALDPLLGRVTRFPYAVVSKSGMLNTDSWCFLPLCAVRRGPIRDDTCSTARYMALDTFLGRVSLRSGVEGLISSPCRAVMARHKYLRQDSVTSCFFPSSSLPFSIKDHVFNSEHHHHPSPYTIFSLSHHQHPTSSQASITSTSQRCPISSAKHRVR